MSAPNPKKEKQAQQGGSKKGNPQQKGSSQQQKQKAPPKAKSNFNADDMKADQKLQAIILADSFAKTFRPITLECPKVLLPLVNVPMLDYTIEFLSQNGVEEIFVFCVWHAELVEEYLKTSPWRDLLSIHCISSSTCSSAGDALRELDGMNIIRSDPFILVSGDVVSNINLKKAIAYHKKKRAEDMNSIMTLTLKRVQKTAGVKPILDDLVVGMHKTSSQIILFDDSYNKGAVRVPLDLMRSAGEVVFSTEFMDCNVDICSPELILQFSDNYDYQDIRKDFIHNEVSNHALGKHIYGYVLQNEYAARVQDPRSYHSICRDIVTRWAYPLVPDVKLLQGDSTYSQSNRYVYKEQGTKVSRSAHIVEEVVIGRGTVIGDHSIISRSTIGRDVRVGNNVKIEESHIWGKVVIEDNVTIHQAIICEGAVIKAGSIIPKGAIVSFNVVVNAADQLGDFVRLTKFGTTDSNGVEWHPEDESNEYNDEQDDNESVAEIDAARALRMSSVGCTADEQWKRNLWTQLAEPIEDDESDNGFDGDAKSDEDAMTEDGNEDSSDSNDSDSNDDSIDDTAALKSPKKASSSSGFVRQSSGSRGSRNNLGDGNSFTELVSELVVAALQEAHPSSATLMEIKSLKFAHNKTFADCLRGVVYGIFSAINEKSVKETVLKVKSLLEEDSQANEIISALTQNIQDELEIINSVEDFVLIPEKHAALSTSFSFFLHAFYDEGLLSENALLLWAKNKEKIKASVESGALVPTTADTQRLAMFQHPLMTQFLLSVEEGSEEEEDDEEEDEGEEDD